MTGRVPLHHRNCPVSRSPGSAASFDRSYGGRRRWRAERALWDLRLTFDALPNCRGQRHDGTEPTTAAVHHLRADPRPLSRQLRRGFDRPPRSTPGQLHSSNLICSISLSIRQVPASLTICTSVFTFEYEVSPSTNSNARSPRLQPLTTRKLLSG